MLILLLLGFLIIKTNNDTSKTMGVKTMVRIDSISHCYRYEFMPDIRWMYHTKYGIISDNRKNYNVGDSISVILINANEKE